MPHHQSVSVALIRKKEYMVGMQHSGIRVGADETPGAKTRVERTANSLISPSVVSRVGPTCEWDWVGIACNVIASCIVSYFRERCSDRECEREIGYSLVSNRMSSLFFAQVGARPDLTHLRTAQFLIKLDVTSTRPPDVWCLVDRGASRRRLASVSARRASSHAVIAPVMLMGE